MNYDDMQPLIYEGDTDYKLKPDETTLWVTVGPFSINVCNYLGKVTTAIYKTGEEDEEAISIATAYKDD